MPTILVADDNSNIQKMVTLAFKDQGIDVVAVGNGEAAVRKLPDALPDLVLADVFMPVRNGYEVCEFVKRDARFAHIPVVLLVGAFDPLDEHEAQRVGADGVLKKPFVPPEPLISMVKSLLEHSASARLVPVGVTVKPTAEEKTAPPLAEVPAEPVPEEFFLGPARIEFGKHEAPLAFGELLGTLPAEAEHKPGPAAAHDAGLGDVGLWQGAAATEQPAAGHDTPFWQAPQNEEGILPEEPEIAPKEPSALSSFAGERAPAEEAEARAVETSSTRGLAELLASSAFGPESQEAGATTPTEPAAEAPLQGVAPFRADQVQSFSIPQPPNPQLVDAVVTRVIERLQPQIMDIVTREVVRPVVEALVRRELEKH